MDFNSTATPIRLANEEIRIHACFDYPVQFFVVHP